MDTDNELFRLESAAYLTRAFFAIFGVILTAIVVFVGCCFRTACKGKVFLTYSLAVCDFIIAIFWCLIAVIGETFSLHKYSSFDATIVAMTITIVVTALKFTSYLLVTTYCVNSAMKIREIYTNQGREMGAGDRRKRYRQSRIRIWLSISIIFPLIYGVIWLTLTLASFHDFAKYNSEIKAYNISPGIFGYTVSIDKNPFQFDWDLLWLDLQIVSLFLVNIFLVVMLIFNAIIYMYIACHIAKNRGLYLLDRHDYKLACFLALGKTLFIIIEEITLLMATIAYCISTESFSNHKFDPDNEVYVIFLILLLPFGVIQGLQGAIHVIFYGVFKSGFTSAIKTYHRTQHFVRDHVIRPRVSTRNISQESDALVHSTTN
ncbi:hypothetical protein LOD99_5749 [Oopsacas minuta]|uniref:Uncharacterized protein n=1 Tax=Oopsacas minuta TaxID=111878 RepID=A0AAV7JPZ8_9METZ|nr:hypothetical protein LOD99_5749 [Oopsacas minuta]